MWKRPTAAKSRPWAALYMTSYLTVGASHARDFAAMGRSYFFLPYSMAGSDWARVFATGLPGALVIGSGRANFT